MPRKPLALANWKMAMAVAEGLAFVHAFQSRYSDLLAAADVVICPPYTSLWPLAQEVRDNSLQLGGQNIAAATDPTHTGEISAALLADVGCRWVMLGHWEVRQNLGDDDAIVNRKVHLAHAADLTPILLVGEGRAEPGSPPEILRRRLAQVLDGCRPEQVARMAFVYEPEGMIGQAAPASPEHVATGCTTIRSWIERQWGAAVAEQVRIIYGGSVTAEHAADLLARPDVDGLGAGRRGRDATTFAGIVRQIVQSKGA